MCPRHSCAKWMLSRGLHRYNCGKQADRVLYASVVFLCGKPHVCDFAPSWKSVVCHACSCELEQAVFLNLKVFKRCALVHLHNFNSWDDKHSSEGVDTTRVTWLRVAPTML